MTADEVIARFGLQPHPEGGHFAETFRDPRTVDGRSVSTAILFLLKSGETSHWHRVDATEIWHHYVGAPLQLQIAEDKSQPTRTLVLGDDLGSGHRPQIVVPAGHWQSARSVGEWTLVGCTVAPGFEFSGFELASAGWTP
jgi:predicted cupin superfamily sugar epimerase